LERLSSLEPPQWLPEAALGDKQTLNLIANSRRSKQPNSGDWRRRETRRGISGQLTKPWPKLSPNNSNNNNNNNNNKANKVGALSPRDPI
jgi:hypothetical protein